MQTEGQRVTTWGATVRPGAVSLMPALIGIDSISAEAEVFDDAACATLPRDSWAKVLDALNATGYGLTLWHTTASKPSSLPGV
jgi:delta 1-pyrroline-5-carboxylate dehydrogenase